MPATRKARERIRQWIIYRGVFYAGRSMASTALFAHYSMHRRVPFRALPRARKRA